MDEFIVKTAAKVKGQKNCVFKLHKDDKISWADAKMRRESEFQPWQIKLGSGRAARKFKAIREGGVGENASYFVFYKPESLSDTYEVCPIDEWYSVSATHRYKTLTEEEAEHKFEQRHKTLNLFSVMHLKKNGESGEEGRSASDSKSFKVSELDDWEQSGDESAVSDEEGGEKSHKRKSIKKETNDADEAPIEAKEDSDEGDFEQRELDYMSDSSSESSEAAEENLDGANVKGIAEETALRDLLSTDDEDAEGDSPQKSTKFVTSKNTLGTVDIKQDPDAVGSDDSSDSEDYDVDEDKMDSLFMKKSLPAQLVKQEQGGLDPAHDVSNAGTAMSAAGVKRKAPSADGDTSPTVGPSTSINPQPLIRRPCVIESSTSPPGSQEKMIEDLIKKYLRRKPTPTRVLLKDIKSKLRRTGTATSDLDNNMLVQTIASIIKRLDPIKQKINDTIYFSLNGRD